MAVAFGPLRARFTGSATVSYDDTARSGTIRGEGRDSATGTRLKTEAEFRVTDASAGTSRIELTAGYALQGPLAQFSRGALVQSLAGEALPRGRAQPGSAADRGLIRTGSTRAFQRRRIPARRALAAAQGAVGIDLALARP